MAKTEEREIERGDRWRMNKEQKIKKHGSGNENGWFVNTL